MKLEIKISKAQFIVIGFLVFIMSAGGTYALEQWRSDQTSISGTTMCFDILYDGDDVAGAKDINFGTVVNGTVVDGMVAANSFSDAVRDSKVASTTVNFSRRSNCLIYGKGTLTVDITSTADLTTGAFKYKIYNDTASREVAEGSITSSGETDIYTNFDIIESTDYTIYFWLDASLINNSYLTTEFTGTVSASAISTPEHD